MTEKSIVNHVFVLQRNGKSVDKDKGQPVQPFRPERVPVQVPRQEAWVPPRTLYCTPLMDPYLIDGRVIFRVIYVKNVTDTISATYGARYSGELQYIPQELLHYMRVS